MSKWNLSWILWLVAFFAIELPAVFNDEPDDTLTEHISTHMPLELAVVVYGALVAWLPVHFYAAYQRAKSKKASQV